jgi:hypothetical protein
MAKGTGFCGIDAEGHPEMWVGGKLTAEMNAVAKVEPSSGVKLEGPATLYRPNAMEGVMTVDTKNNTCSADLEKGGMWGMTRQTVPFVGPLPKP